MRLRREEARMTMSYVLSGVEVALILERVYDRTPSPSVSRRYLIDRSISPR